MQRPNWIESTLAEQRVPYRLRHHRARFTSQDVAAEEHVSGHRMAKVVMVKAGDEMAMVVLPASRRLDMEAVGAALGAPCHLATEKEIAERLIDCEVGATPPLPHWEGLTMLADESLMQADGPLVFQAGTHEDAVELSSSDWRRVAHPKGGRFAQN